MSDIGDIMEYNEEVKLSNKRNANKWILPR